jgi:hypothetical protein
LDTNVISILSCLAPAGTPSDNTAPSVSFVDVQGTPKKTYITVQDTGSGLASIVIKSMGNDTVVIPPFTVGTKNPVVILVTRIDSRYDYWVVIWDPVVVTLICGRGAPVPVRLSAPIGYEEHFVRITNHQLGITTLEIQVNGRKFQVGGLKNNEVRTVDVLSAMSDRSNNVFILTATGKAGGSADVLVWEGQRR